MHTHTHLCFIYSVYIYIKRCKTMTSISPLTNKPGISKTPKAGDELWALFNWMRLRLYVAAEWMSQGDKSWPPCAHSHTDTQKTRLSHNYNDSFRTRLCLLSLSPVRKRIFFKCVGRLSQRGRLEKKKYVFCLHQTNVSVSTRQFLNSLIRSGCE